MLARRMRAYLMLVISAIFSSVISAKSCESFYSEFRNSEKFRIEHTKFPLKVLKLSCCDNEDVKRSSIVHKENVINKKIKIYPNYETLKKHNYVEVIKQINKSECDLIIGPKGSDVAISYKFRKFEDQWKLVEFVDHWGS